MEISVKIYTLVVQGKGSNVMGRDWLPPIYTTASTQIHNMHHSVSVEKILEGHKAVFKKDRTIRISTHSTPYTFVPNLVASVRTVMACGHYLCHCDITHGWGLGYWTGLLDWTTGLDYWTGLLDYWTAGRQFTT